MPESLHFLTAGDAGVSWGIAGVAGSLLKAVPQAKAFTLTVIDGGISQEIRHRLAQAFTARPGARLRFVPFTWPEGCDAPPLEGSRVAYARMFASEWVADPVCLYVDADTVLLEDPSELFDLASAAPEVPLFAGPNYPGCSYRDQIGRQSRALISAVDGDPCYFNSGVLLMNLDLWRGAQVARSCLELAARHQFIAHDQDALNVHFLGRWKALPERWNFQLYERTHYPAEAALLHYSGRNKPWASGYPAGARAPFLGALAAAGFSDWRPEISLATWLRNSSLRPVLSKAQYWARRSLGLNGVARR